MALNTFSIFYYIDQVTRDNNNLNFNEGSGELLAAIEPSGYSIEQLMASVKAALDDSGTQVYTVNFDRTTRLVTISASSSFDLLITSGSQAGTSIFSLLGFTGADLTGQTSYTSNNAIGSIYEPQFILQNYVSSDDYQEAVGASVVTSTAGDVEVVRFGLQKFVEFDIKFSTNRMMDGKVIRNNPNGINDLQAFMQFITTKARFEFMVDKSDRNTFQTLLLERTPQSSNGIGYKLKERFDQNLPGFFDTGILRCRIV